ncbi:MAG: hypothetical protein M1150_01165 [Patescibacteria group bacterium]|nr:hypothetical protein [Patescibacteria group bacterium]
MYVANASSKESILREQTTPGASDVSANSTLVEKNLMGASLEKSSPLASPQKQEFIQPNRSTSRFFSQASSGSTHVTNSVSAPPKPPTGFFNQELTPVNHNFFSSSTSGKSSAIQQNTANSYLKPSPVDNIQSPRILTSSQENSKAAYAEHHSFSKSTDTLPQRKNRATTQDYLHQASNFATIGLLILLGGLIIYLNAAPADQVSKILQPFDFILHVLF